MFLVHIQALIPNVHFFFTFQNTVTVIMLNLLAVLHICKANKIHPMSDARSGNGIGGVIHLLKSDYTEYNLRQRYKCHFCIALNFSISFDKS